MVGMVDPAKENMKKVGLADLLAFTAPLALYLSTLAPTIHLGDSGELTVGAAMLGIPHVPGYPLLAQIAHLVMQLPLAAIAWRGNLFSALCGAAAVWAAYRLLLALTGHRLAALTAALTLAGSYTLWEQSLKIRAYPLNTFFTALVLWSTVRWRLTFDRRFLFTACFLTGLGMANHEILSVVAFVPLTLMIAHWRKLRLGDWPLAAGLGVLGLTVYLYLPLRALNDPVLNWGDPSSWSRLKDVLLQSQYSFKMLNPDWGAKLEMVGVIARSLILEPGCAAFLLGGAGLILLARRDASLVIGLLLLVIVNIALRINYIGPDEMFQVKRYMISSYLVIIIGLGVCLARLEEAAAASFAARRAAPAYSILCVILIAWPVTANYRFNRQQTNWVAYETWQNALSHPEPTYGLFVGGDNAVFPLWYLQMVEKRRPTVLVFPREGFHSPWLLRKMGEQLARAGGAELPERILRLEAAYRDPKLKHGLYLSTLANLLEYGQLPFALTVDRLEVQDDNEKFQELQKQAATRYEGSLIWWVNPRPTGQPGVWRFYQTASILDPDLPRDHHTEAVAVKYAVYYYRLARYDAGTDDPLALLEALHHAILADPRSFEMMGNLANVYLHLGDPERAAYWCDRALAIDPDNRDLLALRSTIEEMERQAE